MQTLTKIDKMKTEELNGNIDKPVLVVPALTNCKGHRDGDCFDKRCPQLIDGEPEKSGRHCPLDIDWDYE